MQYYLQNEADIGVTRVEQRTNILSESPNDGHALLTLLTGVTHHSTVDTQYGRRLHIEWATNNPSSSAQKWCTSTYGGNDFSADVQNRQY